MDVQSVAGVGATPAFGSSTDAPGALSEQISQPPAQPPVAAPNEQSAAPTEQSRKDVGAHAGDSSTLRDPLAKLYGSQTPQFEVSFRVEHDPNMVVTVFRDAATGEEIAQFPPELMVQLAQFFEKLAGAVVDRSA